MRHCPNPQCPYSVRHHKPASYGDHAQSCSDCESALIEGEGGIHEASLPVGFGVGTVPAAHTNDVTPWLLTLAPAALLALLFIPVLGFEWDAFDQFADGHIWGLPFSRVFSFFSVGVSSYITAILVVEVVAALFPSLRYLRTDAVGRSRLTRFSLGLGSFFVLGRAILLAITLGSIEGRAPFVPALVSLLLASAVAITVVMAVTRFGRANGFSILVLVMLLPDVYVRGQDAVTKLQLGDTTPMEVLLVAAAIGAVCLLAYRIFDDRPLWSRRGGQQATAEADSWVRTPVVGLASLSLAAVILAPLSTLMYTLRTLTDSDVFSRWVTSDVSNIAFLGMTLVFWGPLAKAFFPTEKVLFAARQLQPDASGAVTLDGLQAALRSRRIKEGALLLVILWMSQTSLLETFYIAPLTLAAVVAVVAIIRDLREEWDARAAAGKLVFVDTVARTWEASILKEACEREPSISVVVIRGFWHRSLFHFLAPHLSLDVYAIPSEVDRVQDRLEIIRSVSAGVDASVSGPAPVVPGYPTTSTDPMAGDVGSGGAPGTVSM